MGKYDDLADEAADDTDDELSGKLKSLSLMDYDSLKKLMPEKLDQEKIDKFKDAINESTDNNKRRQVYLDLLGDLSEAGAKIAEGALRITKKALLPLLLAAMLPAAAAAAMIDVSGPLDWVKTHADQSRYGLAINFKAKAGFAGYLPLIWDRQKNYWDLGIGYTHFEGGVDHMTAGFGINLVTTSHDLWKRILGKRVAVLPMGDIWIGPYIEAPPLDNINEKWIIGERTGVQIVYKLFK